MGERKSFGAIVGNIAVSAVGVRVDTTSAAAVGEEVGCKGAGISVG